MRLKLIVTQYRARVRLTAGVQGSMVNVGRACVIALQRKHLKHRDAPQENK